MNSKPYDPYQQYVPLKWEKMKQIIDPATLSQNQRQWLWLGIQKEDPALADCLKNDKTLAELKRTFNGTTVFEVDDVHRFIQSGQKGK